MALTETLVQVSKVLGTFLEKTKYKTRMRSSLLRLMREQEKRMRPEVNEFLDLMIKEIRKGLPKLRGKKAKDIEHLADWGYIREESARIMKPALLEALVAGGDSVVRRKIVKQERFDPIGVEAVTWADIHAAELVTMVSEETEKAIRAYVVEGVKRGKSIPKIAREMRPVVGLNERQAGAVGKFATELFTRPKYSALTDAQRNSKIERYARKLQRIRTETIARTETASALSEGTLQGYGQMGIKRVEGVSDPDACQDCKDEINGKVYTLAEASGKIPVHPDCECGWVAA